MLAKAVAGRRRDHGLAQNVLVSLYSVRALRPLSTCTAIFNCSRARAVIDNFSTAHPS